MLTQGYRYADASVISGFDFVAMIWAVTLGWLLFAEIPAPRVLAGATLVVAASAALLAWERRAPGVDRAAGRQSA